MSSQPQPPSRPQRAAQAFTLLLTNVTKLTGVVLAVDQLLIKSQTTSQAIGLCALMIAGGQLSETLVLAFLDKSMGSETPPPDRRPPRKRH